MINRKKIFIILGVCVLLVAIIAVVITLNKKTNQPQQQATETVTPFSIDGLDNPSYALAPATQSAVVSQIKLYLVKADINTTNLKGKVRDNSYTEKEVDGGSLKELLVDIPDIKRTYKVSAAASDTDNGDDSLFIVCPSKDELIYGTFKCQSDVQAGEGSSI